MSQDYNFHPYYCPEEELCLKRLKTEIGEQQEEETSMLPIVGTCQHTTHSYLHELHKLGVTNRRTKERIMNLYSKMLQKGETKGIEYFRSILKNLDNGNLDHLY